MQSKEIHAIGAIIIKIYTPALRSDVAELAQADTFKLSTWQSMLG